MLLWHPDTNVFVADWIPESGGGDFVYVGFYDPPPPTPPAGDTPTPTPTPWPTPTTGLSFVVKELSIPMQFNADEPCEVELVLRNEFTTSAQVSEIQLRLYGPTIELFTLASGIISIGPGAQLYEVYTIPANRLNPGQYFAEIWCQFFYTDKWVVVQQAYPGVTYPAYIAVVQRPRLTADSVRYSFNGPLGSVQKTTCTAGGLQFSELNMPSSCMGFDGTIDGAYAVDTSDDYLNLGLLFIPNSAGFSGSAWIKTTATTHGVILCAVDDARNVLEFSVTANGTLLGALDFTLSEGGTGVTAVSSQTVNDGTWHHVAFTADNCPAARIKIYIDGQLAATDQHPIDSYNITDFQRGWFVGVMKNYATGNAQQSFVGAIDELFLATYFCTAEQIAQEAGVVVPPEQPTPTPTVPSTLVASYSFSGGQVGLDTVSGQLLTIGGAVQTTAGISGDGLRFDGSSNTSFTKADSSRFNFGTGDFTIACWFNSNRTSMVAGSFMGLVTKMQSSNPNHGYHLRLYVGSYAPDFGKLYFELHDPAYGKYAVLSTAALNDGAWHHVVAVRAGGDLRLYIDGTLNASRTGLVAGFNGDNADGLVFGAISEGLGSRIDNPLDGTLDEVRIFRTALDATAVADLYIASGP